MHFYVEILKKATAVLNHMHFKKECLSSDGKGALNHMLFYIDILNKCYGGA